MNAKTIVIMSLACSMSGCANDMDDAQRQRAASILLPYMMQQNAAAAARPGYVVQQPPPVQNYVAPLPVARPAPYTPTMPTTTNCVVNGNYATCTSQ